MAAAGGAAALAACLGLAGAGPAAGAAANTQLVITPTSISPLGWHGAGGSVTAARAALRSGLSRHLTRAVKRSAGEAAGAAKGPQRLSSAAFVFSSPADAHRVLSAYRHAHHAGRLALGSDGSMWRSRRGRSVRYVLTWRRGPRVALLQMQLPKRTKRGSVLVLAMAKLADATLQTTLPTTAFGKIESSINADGTVSAQTALQAFALTYGGLSGVKVPSGTGSTPPLDGTLASAWVLQHLSQYSPTLQTAIWHKMGVVPGGNVQSSERRAHAAFADAGDPRWTQDATLTALANAQAVIEGGRIGAPLKYTILAGTTPALSGNTDADTFPEDASGHYDVNGPNCVIRFALEKNKPEAAAYIRGVLAHEVFHCFQFQIAGAAWRDLPGWTMEGAAEWVALDVTSPAWDSNFPNGDSTWMQDNILHPDTPLFTRTYGAIDFWGHVQDTYGDLWTRLPAVLKAHGSNAIFAAAGGNADKFLFGWASSLADLAGAPAAWHLTSPIAVPDGHGVHHNDIRFAAGAPLTNIAVPAYTTKHFTVQPDGGAPLVHIKINGHARFSSKHDYSAELRDGWFCLAGSAAACKCPDGQHGVVPVGFATNGAGELEITGDPRAAGSAGTVEYSQLNKFCTADYKVPKPAGDQAPGR